LFQRRRSLKILEDWAKLLRICALMSSCWIIGGRAGNTGDIDPSLVKQAQNQDTPTTKPLHLGRETENGLVTNERCDVGLDSTPFAGGSKKSVAFPWLSFNGWLQCPAMPCISPLAVRLGYAIRHSL